MILALLEGGNAWSWTSWQSLGSFVLGMAGMFGYQGAFDPVGWYDSSTGWAQLACLALFVAIPLVVGDAMRRGEEPEGHL